MPSMRVSGMNCPVRFHFPGRKELLEVNRKYRIKTCVGKICDDSHYANRGKAAKKDASYLGEAVYSVKDAFKIMEEAVARSNTKQFLTKQFLKNWIIKKASEVRSFLEVDNMGEMKWNE